MLLSTSDSTSVLYCQSSQCVFQTDDGFSLWWNYTCAVFHRDGTWLVLVVLDYNNNIVKCGWWCKRLQACGLCGWNEHFQHLLWSLDSSADRHKLEMYRRTLRTMNVFYYVMFALWDEPSVSVWNRFVQINYGIYGLRFPSCSFSRAPMSTRLRNFLLGASLIQR